MTTQTVSLQLEPREVLGKKVKQLRRSGIVPVHLYGPGVESRAVQCRAQTLIQALSAAGGNTPITVTIQGEPGNQLAFAREIQWDPRRDDLLHVDLLVAEASRQVSAQVPIVLSGEAPGARVSDGTVVQQLRSVDVEALPLEMPAQIEVDLAVLAEPDSVVRAGDLALPASVTLLTEPEEVVVRIELPRALVEGAVEAEREETGEATSGAEEN